jgi:hypothetical protein
MQKSFSNFVVERVQLQICDEFNRAYIFGGKKEERI